MTNNFIDRLSQGQLNLLETCPPQFQRIYLEQLSSPISPEQQEKLAWGKRFHLLMQQRELNLPIEPLLEEDREIGRAFLSLVDAAPEIFHLDRDTWREAEHSRTLQFENYLLTVIYDLLITNSFQAQIIDWKTYLQPPNMTKLEKNWQTRLYLYVLAETSEYVPEKISMSYWFVKLVDGVEKVTFNYNSQKHRATRNDLTRLLINLDNYLEDYLKAGTPFPHKQNCGESCPYYKSFCLDRSSVLEKDLNKQKNWLANIAEIEEICL
jgi:hypothetical protein